MEKPGKEESSRYALRLVAIGCALGGVVLVFFLPMKAVELSPGVWYPYSHSLQGYGSVTYAYLGYGAVYWSPNHYWIYLGRSVLQITNSSASTITVRSVDQYGRSIFGYFVIVSDPGGHVTHSGYTTETFPSTAGQRYILQVEGYGSCRFTGWTSGATTPALTVLATSGDRSFTSVFQC